ncbi:MAG: hypothetical protein BWX86_02655 [Verrucomicrobia bacterium ADurb.Bin122]|nr:MAG: hypothetical protein BWX86_02655 [Verrucomicrobia bacterium ADurb.Bin122]
MMVVSIISTGAGSVGVSNRPSLPATEATSGICRMVRSCHAMMRLTSVNDVLGTSTGMKRRLPSSSVGMNSLPKPRAHAGSPSAARQVRGRPKAITRQHARSATARDSTVLRARSAQSRTGS